MKKVRRALLLTAGLCLAGPAMSAPPASAEVCAAGHVGSTPLPGCNNCPPGIFVGPNSVEPFASVFLCVHP